MPAEAGTAAGDPFDVDYSRDFVRRVLAPITHGYFRARIVGAERIPRNGPLVLACNHSGNAFPYDGMVLDGTLWERDGCEPSRKLRTVYEPELSFVWWMRPYGLDNFWRRAGGVDMTFDNFDRLLARGDRVLYFPEGVPGIGKGFNRRYELQQFRSSFVVVAARHHAPVLPVYAINAEWIHPFGYTLPPLDRLMQRLFYVPFLPLPLGLAAIALPWIWFLAFPARLVFVVGKPIDVEALLRAEGVERVAPDDPPDRAAARRAAERVRQLMQEELDEMVERFGRSRYAPRSLFRKLRERRWSLWRVLPVGWPVSFLVHDRDRRRPPARNRLHAILRDWDLAAFYVPFGWPLLTLARIFRRPPCGYRGVPRAEARRRQGSRLWKLAEQPLPPRTDVYE